jgi:hypothetical protein
VSDRTLELGGKAPLIFGAAGLVVLGLGVIVGSRTLKLVGAAGAVAGAGLYARERYAARGEKIDAAEDSIRSTLDDLDPVARAQVLIDVAKP